MCIVEFEMCVYHIGGCTHLVKFSSQNTACANNFDLRTVTWIYPVVVTCKCD